MLHGAPRRSPTHSGEEPLQRHLTTDGDRLAQLLGEIGRLVAAWAN